MNLNFPETLGVGTETTGVNCYAGWPWWWSWDTNGDYADNIRQYNIADSMRRLEDITGRQITKPMSETMNRLYDDMVRAFEEARNRKHD